MNIITEHIDTWTSAIKAKSSAGRGGGKKRELYGIKKLRELILELAVRGLLVSQDPNDEPASELLKKIAAEKAKLLKEGRIKKQRKLQPISDEEKPFKLPRGWVWARLQDVTSKITDGDHKTPPRISSGKRLLSAKNIRDGYIDYINCDYISEADYAKSRERCLPEPGDLLIVSVGGTIGRSSTIPKDSEFALVRSVALIKPLGFLPEYLKRSADSPLLQNSIHSNKRGGAQPCLYLSEISKFPLPLPPLAEQRRIVAKVDELMALCDQLELRQEDSLQMHQTLVKTLLSALTSASDSDRFSDAWKMIESNFDTLFTTESSINELKQTILQLAVMGKLVPQDPNDEPATELLKKIASKNAELIKEGKAKKQKAKLDISTGKEPFHTPNTWKWCHFQEIANIASNLVKPDAYLEYPHLAPDNIEKGNGVLLPCSTVKEDKVRSSNHRFYSGQIIYSKIRPNLSKVVIVDFDGLCSADMYPIDSLIDSRYLQYYILSKPFLDQAVKTDTRVAMPKINQKELNAIEVPIPPLAEQHRIVAKVDELMALCDRLKAGIQTAQTTQLHLADTLVESAIN